MTHMEQVEPVTESEPDATLIANTGTGTTSVAAAAGESVKSELEGELPEGAIPIYVECTMAVADHLSNMHHEPLTLKSLFEAKVAALEFCISTTWMERMCKAVVENTPGADTIFSSHDMLGRMLTMLPALVGQLREIATDVPAFLQSIGVDEQQFMESPKVSLNAANLQKYREGTLTIGDLFMTQPSVIITNTD